MVRLQGEEAAQAMIEYALFMALVVLAILTGIGFAGGQIQNAFSSTAEALAELAQ